MRKCNTSTGTLLIVSLIVIILVLGSGCINKIFPRGDADTMESLVLENGNDGTAAQSYVPTSSSLTAVPAITPQKSELVQEIAPVIPVDTFSPRVIPAVLQEDVDPPRVEYGCQYNKTYKLNFNGTGLRVNVAEAPFVLTLDFSPLWECDDNGCRSPPSRYPPYALVTVRDAATGEIVAEDGYRYGYSTEETKKIILYRSGIFDVSLYGAAHDVSLEIATGESRIANLTKIGPTPTPTFAEVPWEEEERG